MTIFPDSAATDYDARILRMVPGYALAQEILACALAARLERSSRILVVGCGTGSELIALAKQLPDARFTAVEPSGGMLAVARKKVDLAGLSSRVDLVQGLLDDVAERSFDAAVVILVLHFLADDGRKADFLSGVRERLGKNGMLALFDPVAIGEEATYDRWLAGGGLGAAERGAIIARARNDWHCVTAERLDELLRQAGFASSTLLFNALNYRGLVAIASGIA